MKKKSSYTIKRYLIEEFEVKATSRKEALEKYAIEGNPGKVGILKETVRSN